MAFVYTHGRERINPRRPLGFRICDRCGFAYTRTDLTWQYSWAGSTLQNLRILVCPTCLDIPNPQLRAYVVPPDPLPFDYPRIEVDAGWPMEVGPIYDTRNVLIRDTSGVVLDTSGGVRSPLVTPPVGQVYDSLGVLVLDDFGIPIVIG